MVVKPDPTTWQAVCKISRPEPHSELRPFCKTKSLNNRISITSLNNRVLRLYNDENENRGLKSFCVVIPIAVEL